MAERESLAGGDTNFVNRHECSQILLGDAVLTNYYLINRMPSIVPDGIPYSFFIPNMTRFFYLLEFSVVYVLFVIIVLITPNWILKFSNVSFWVF